MMKFKLLIFICAFALLLAPLTFAFYGELDEFVYVTNDTIVISGNSDYNTSIDVNATISLDGSAITTFGTTSTGAFNFNTTLTNYSNGDYSLLLSQNYTENITLYFTLVGEELHYSLFILNDSTVYIINTSTNVTSGANFTDLLGIGESQSGTIKYGVGNMGDYVYSFVLTDPAINGTYTKAYVDDDANFAMYNTTEDSTGIVEKQLNERGIYKRANNESPFVLAGINSTGTHAIVGHALNSSTFSQNDTAYYLLIIEDSSGNIKSGENFSLVITAPDGTETNVTGQTNASGVYTGSITLDSIGSYVLDVTDGVGVEFINVESYTVNPKTTDLQEIPRSSFTPGSSVRLSIITKSGSTRVNMTSIWAIVTDPNGDTTNVTFNISTTGTYYYDYETSSSLSGSYGITVTTLYSGVTQNVNFGFQTESTRFEMFAINTAYLEQAGESQEVFVEAFAPGTNITIMAFQTDITQGGYMGESGTIDIENSTANRTCADAVSIVELRDDNNRVYPVSSLQAMIRSLENLSGEGFFPAGVTPPAPMLNQCMIVIQNTSLPTGFYSLKAKLQIGTPKEYTATPFSIQRLMASGQTVDRNGENFNFFSPGTQVNVKIKLRDMVTETDLNGTQIIEASLVELTREHPTYADVLSNVVNESYTNGVLSFVAPNSEGFHRVGFRFKANISGTIYEGFGNAFIELKKYIIFGSPQNQFGPSLQRAGDNITLQVYIVDIDRGSLFDIGFSPDGTSSRMSCTGCAGYITTVTNIFNDQLLQEVDSSDYAISNGSVLNETSGASVIIEQLTNFDPGFYRIDIQVVNPEDENETYFGWGFFEIRNFFVSIDKALYNSTNDTFSAEDSSDQGFGFESDMQFETGTNMYMRINAKIPSPGGPQTLNITSAEVMNILDDQFDGPPIYIDATTALTQETYIDEQCFGDSCNTQEITAWILNISGMNDPGEYMLNVRATSAQGQDIGTAFLSLSSFQLELTYRDSESWNPLFSSDEVINITLNATNFTDDESYEGRDLDTATVAYIFNMRDDKLLSIDDDQWSSTCDGSSNLCYVLVNLSTFTRGNYEIEIEVNDTDGNEATGFAEIEIRDVLFGVPQLLESWNWFSDTAETGSIELTNSEDFCTNSDLQFRGNDDNEHDLQTTYKNVDKTPIDIFYNLIGDTCTGDDTKVCGSYNLTNLSLNKTNYTYTSTLLCLNMTDGQNVNIANCVGDEFFVPVAIVSTNDSFVWIAYNATNETFEFNMTGAANNTAINDTISVGNRTWVTKNLGGTTYNYTDNNVVYYAAGSLVAHIRVTEKPSTIYFEHYCIDGGNYIQRNSNCLAGEQNVYALHNGTYGILSYTDDATGSWTTSGLQTKTSDGLGIASIGLDNQGVVADQMRIINGSFYGRFYPQIGTGDFIVVPQYYTNMYGSVFCVYDENANDDWKKRKWQSLEWEGGTCGANSEEVYVFSNSTHVWFGVNDNDLSGETAHTTTTNNVTDAISGYEWSLTSLNITNFLQSFEMKLANNLICGQSWTCNQQGCTQSFFEIVAPQSDTNFAFGQINMIRDEWELQGMFNGFNNATLNVFAYHNRTHLFFTNSSGNFSGVTGVEVNDNITDPYDGYWTVKSLTDSTLSLIGLNRTAKIGAEIDMTLSQSNTVRIGIIRENELGFFKMEGARSGMDLNGDGLTNESYYYVLTDANTAGLYDTFFFSSNNSFVNDISIDADRETRTIVNTSDISLTLLSIDPRANKIILYSSDIGDWSDLGDLAVNTSVRIPFILQKPNGDSVTSTVKGVGAYFIDSTNQKTYQNFTEVSITTGAGLGELVLNNTNTGYDFESGTYYFEMKANTSTNNYSLDEWMWPRAKIRPFLTTTNLGKGGWIYNFTNITIKQYNDQTGYRTQNLRSINLSWEYGDSGTIYGVLEDMRNENSTDCGYVAPAGASEATFTIRESMRFNNPQYYYYFSGTPGDGNIVWATSGDCNFTAASNYSLGDYMNVTVSDKLYMLQILALESNDNVNNNNSYVMLGVNTTEWAADGNTNLSPVRSDDFGQEWRLLSFNLTGTYFNALFVNSSTHAMCDVINWECASGAYLTTTGTFVGPYTAGDTLPVVTDYYVAGIGPSSWEGLTLANSSGLSFTPLFGNMRLADDTVSLIREVNESDESLDFNLDGDLTDTFYIFLFDDRSNNEQTLTNVVIDDDIYITPQWQGFGQATTRYDYLGNETGIAEQWGSLPNAIWRGGIEFGPNEENDTYRQLPFEQKANWEVLLLSDDDLLIAKEFWCGLTENDTLNIIMKAYEFNQTAINGAAMNVTEVFKFGFQGDGIYNSSAYNVTAATTDATGYGVMTVAPNPTWATGPGGAEYIFRVLVNDSVSTASVDRFARIGGGGCGW